MERKVGEIFEYNGEWYQCVKDTTDENCGECDFRIKCKFEVCGVCCSDYREDKQSVCLKKLQKVGEPFERNGYMYQEYKVHTFPVLMNGDAKIPTPNGFAVIIKNKEDMEEGNNPNLSNTENIGKNLKPFNIEEAKAGKPVCTRDGRKARIICFDRKVDTPIVALIEHVDGSERLQCYFYNGKCCHNETSDYDLMMLFEKKEGWVNVYHGLNGISERVCGDIVSNTKEEAIQYAQNDDRYITTVKIEWEE